MADNRKKSIIETFKNKWGQARIDAAKDAMIKQKKKEDMEFKKKLDAAMAKQREMGLYQDADITAKKMAEFKANRVEDARLDKVRNMKFYNTHMNELVKVNSGTLRQDMPRTRKFVSITKKHALVAGAIGGAALLASHFFKKKQKEDIKNKASIALGATSLGITGTSFLGAKSSNSGVDKKVDAKKQSSFSKIPVNEGKWITVRGRPIFVRNKQGKK